MASKLLETVIITRQKLLQHSTSSFRQLFPLSNIKKLSTIKQRTTIKTFVVAVDKMNTLSEIDSEIYQHLQREKERQRNGLQLIASENFTHLAVLEAVGSCAMNKYAEGYPGNRYYSGLEHIDRIEKLAQYRALDSFGLSRDDWGVNVQPLSGSIANLAVYTALCGPGGRLMGLGLNDGGHLTHGFYTSNKKVSASSLFFESLPYTTDPLTDLIDYEELERNAMLFRPKVIVAGISAYPRHLDYNKFYNIAQKCKAILVADISHVSGLVAHGLAPSPFACCDIVTTTTHKTMRGPRGALIFYKLPYGPAINNAVFPCIQGGPHQGTIAGIAVALKLLKTKEFNQYAQNVINNAAHMADRFVSKNYKVVTGGTDNHMLLIDLTNLDLNGHQVAKVLELVNIYVNKNTIKSDKNAVYPNGIRIGSAAMTSRGIGMVESGKIVDLVDQGIQLALQMAHIKPVLNQKTWPDFEVLSDPGIMEKIKEIKWKVIEFSKKLPLPGRLEF